MKQIQHNDNVKAPKGETVWVRYYDQNKALRYVVTSKQQRDYYYLYEANDRTLKKIARAKIPTDFESKIDLS